MILVAAMLGTGILLHQPYESYKYAHVYGKSVVRLLGRGGGGTGFQMEYAGHTFILTNDHVCGLQDETNRLMIDSPWGQIKMGKVLYHSAKTDLCIVEAHSQLPALHLGTSDFEPHEGLSILGHPLLDKLTLSKGMALKQEVMKILLGVITTPEEREKCTLPKNKIETIFFDMFEVCEIVVTGQATTAKIEPGNSGSPVLDRHGLVRGVAFAAKESDKYADIIPFKSIKEFLDETFKPTRMCPVRRHHREVPQPPLRTSQMGPLLPSSK